MANAVYGKGRESFLKGEIAVNSDTIKAYLYDGADYTVAIDTDQFASDVPTGAKVATSSAMSSKTTTLGVFDVADFVFTAATGDQSEGLVFWQDTGTQGTSRLICNIDTVTSGLPVTPNGTDITVTIDNGANKLFKL